MPKRLVFACFCCCFLSTLPEYLVAQGIQPYPNAVTDRLLRPKTPMAPPPANTVFADPDFGSSMVRVTDQNSSPMVPASYFYNSSSNSWSSDGLKFFVVGQNAINLAFGFDPTTMLIHSLPPAAGGQGFPIPLRADPTFSFLDPDLMYGSTYAAPLTISQYRFSTGVTKKVVDLTTCGTQPGLIKGTNYSSNGTSISSDDNRIATAAGGKQFGKNFFVIVYDKKLGCRWYNTQTGQVGGVWGQAGTVSIANRYPIRHVAVSGSGQYVRIAVDGSVGFYVWDLATLNVTACPTGGGVLGCTTYGAMGFNSYISDAGVGDEMNTVKWPLGNLAGVTKITPIPLPHYWGNQRHFAWRNGQLNDNAPVCGNTYSYDGDMNITQPYDNEIFCIETDGVAQTTWRFAHNRSVWNPAYFYSDPFGNISTDGRFLMFSSTWDNQVGATSAGGPRSDVWIVKLN